MLSNIFYHIIHQFTFVLTATLFLTAASSSPAAPSKNLLPRTRPSVARVAQLHRPVPPLRFLVNHFVSSLFGHSRQIRRRRHEAPSPEGLTALASAPSSSMSLVGKVNKDLVSLINKAGATAVGLSGMDGRLLMVRPSPNSAQLGFVAEVARVDPTVLEPLVNNGDIPVIASVAADEFGQSYNINADTVAGEVAAALGAEKLILLTDVAGILEDMDDLGRLVKEIDIKGVKKMIAEKKVGGGMIPKVNCCVRSLAQGVKTASIIDGRVQHSSCLSKGLEP